MTLIQQNFVPVTGDDWYERRRQDAAGRFYRFVSDQRAPPPPPEQTRQGVYVFTPAGKLLGYSNATKDTAKTHRRLSSALQAWQASEQASAKENAALLAALQATQSSLKPARLPPANGVVARVLSRALQRDKDGQLHHCPAQVGRRSIGTRTAYDAFWIQESEWQSWLALAERVDQTGPVPAEIAYRLARFHLVDNTRGEPDRWRADEVRQLDLHWTVAALGPAGTRLRLAGEFALATDPQLDQAERGFVGALRGHVEYDPALDQIVEFQIIAFGDHWGEGRYTPGARPGRQPLAILIDSQTEFAREVPPQGMRSPNRYYQAAGQ